MQSRLKALLVVALLAALAWWKQASYFASVNLEQHRGHVSSTHVVDDYQEFALETPFYIYEGDLDWWNATVDGKSVRTPFLFDYKHSDDYWMLQAARNHPMRTHDPEKAKLFFVPLLWNVLVSQRADELCTKWPVGPTKDLGNYCGSTRQNCQSTKENCPRKNTITSLLSHADRVLGESPWFQRHEGRDHLLVASHFYAFSYFVHPNRPRVSQRRHQQPTATPRLLDTSRLPHLLSCNILGFEFPVSAAHPAVRNRGLSARTIRTQHIYHRIAWPSMYVGRPCPLTTTARNKTHDFAFVGSLKEKFPWRKEICTWMTESNYSVSVCGHGDQCPALAQSKYGFHIPGDTLGANRPLDTFLSGTVPLFTDDRQYDILPPMIPWRQMSYLVDVSSKEALIASLDKVLGRPESEYQQKLNLIEHHRPFIDHTQPYQFDRYMAELARSMELG